MAAACCMGSSHQSTAPMSITADDCNQNIEHYCPRTYDVVHIMHACCAFKILYLFRPRNNYAHMLYDNFQKLV